MSIRVALVEDHTIVRQGLVALLTAGGFTVVGEAGDGEAALAMIVDLRPDVVVTDLSFPGVHGAEFIGQVRARAPSTRIVVLSMHATAEFVRRAIEAGCDGYVVKGEDISELSSAIRGAMDAKPYYSESVRALLEENVQRDPVARLSQRERQILVLIAHGNTNKEIAAQLGISSHTVNAHRVSLMAKLDIHDAQGLTRFALRHGLIVPT